MSEFILRQAENSNSIQRTFPFYAVYPALSLFGRASHLDPQSSSVTVNGYLWQRSLALCEHIQMPVQVPSSRERTSESEQKRQQKNLALIRLLESWREGDEEEQQNTLAYLRRALDEERPSDRKLFG